MSELIDSLQKELGFRVGVETPAREFIPSGNVALDWAISGRWTGGGLPMGKIVELFGDPSTGKSLLISTILAEAQRLGGVAILDDVENALDPTFASLVGVNLVQLIVLDSETVEEHFDTVKTIVEKIRVKDKKVKIVIALDSLAMLSTKHEQKEGFDKVDMTKAKMIRQGMRVVSGLFSNENVLYLVANHVIANIGVMYGPKTTTPGGTGVPFQSSVRVEMSSRGLVLNEHKKPIGTNVLAKVVKNKIAPPFREVILRIKFESGVEKYSGLFDLWLSDGVVKEKSEGWYWLDGKGARRADIEDCLKDLIGHETRLAEPVGTK